MSTKRNMFHLILDLKVNMTVIRKEEYIMQWG